MGENNILILNSSSIYGGGEYFALKLSSRLKAIGYNVLLGCRKDSLLYNRAKEENVKAIEIGFPAKGTGELKKVINDIRKIIVENSIGIVHTNTNYDRTAGAFAARGTQAAHVTSCHSLESLSHNITHYIRNRFLTKHFICDGESIRDLIVKKNGIPLSKTSVVNNGIDPDEMSRNSVLRENIRNEFNISSDEILIGNTGRMVAFKGQKYLLLGFKNMTEHVSNAKLMLVGDGELMEELKEMTIRMGISDKVIFTGFRDDLQALYSAFDIYAHTSLKGGGELFPFSILYAMAQGLPVVATSTGDIPGMTAEENLGYLTDERSPFQICRCLVELAKNSEIRKSIGNRNLERLKQQFTLNQMVEKIAGIYNNALNSSK